MKVTYPTLLAIVLSAATVPASGATEPPNVFEITDDNGDAFGHLRHSEDDGTLILVEKSGFQMVIGECGDEIAHRVAAPTEGTEAQVYHRNCGATVDFATHVAISRGDQAVIVAVFRGRPHVEVEWIARATLQIRHSALEPQDVFTKDREALGITVSYVAAEEAVKLTDQYVLDFANVNFGATTLAAGTPRELILRWAGWFQEASGMQRKEWNRWFTTPPYGDDPHGHEKILEGFRVYESYKSTEP